MSAVSYSTPLAALEAIALDTETTGLDARSARVVQIGAVAISGREIDKDPCFERLINPGVPIPKAAQAIHGISDEMVAAAPTFAQIISDLDKLMSGVVIGHAIAYDLAVLEREYRLAQRAWRPPRVLCVRTLARLVAPGLAEHTLERLCEWLEIEITGRHTAIGDALAAAEVFAALVPLLRQRNIHSLAEAEAAARQLGDTDARMISALPQAAGDAAADEVQSLSRIDSFPYRHRVQDVMSTPPVFGEESMSVGAAARLLLERKVSSVFVRSAAGTPGIVTERDLLRAIDRDHERGLTTKLGAIASRPLHTVHELAFVYRAIGRMDRLGIRHLGVRNSDGELVGAVTPRNLLRHRATMAILLGDEIHSANTPAALGRAWAKVPIVARSLIREGVDAHTIASVISAEVRALTRRAARLAEIHLRERGLGQPPVRYAILVLGSAGRGESLLAADQDNAIVYERGEAGGPEDRYFEQLGIHMCAILDEVGVRYCKGGVMAKNAQWRMGLIGWQETIDRWVSRQRPEDLLNVDIFFDGVAVHGDLTLGQTIWNYAYTRAGSAADFLKLLANAAHQREAPFTLLRRFRLDADGRIDLKKLGLLPIHTCTRVLSIRHGIRSRATPERLSGLVAQRLASADDVQSITDAHRAILGAILEQQIADSEQGIPLSSKVSPRVLSAKQRSALRAALGKVETVIQIMDEGRL
jgi:CBS domain-containing protein